MKNNQRIIYGLLITIAIFATSMLAENFLILKIDFALKMIVLQITMMILSIVAIYSLRKYVNYKISLPKFKKIFRPILIGFSAPILVNIIIAILTHILGYNLDAHPALSTLNPIQLIFLGAISAPIIEETLFRGFLLNILKPLNKYGIMLFKRKISIPVIISAITFGLAHLILVETGVHAMFLLRIVLAASAGGVIAGYYQEKYDNNAYAIIVHMAINSLSAIMTILLGFNA